MNIPTLEHGCGSWICTAQSGRVVELYERPNVEKAATASWRVETALQYLGRINAEIRQRATGATA